MKIRESAIAVLLALGTTAAYAGNFVSLRTDLPNLTAANGGLVNGIQNPNFDQLYIETTATSYLTGYDDLLSPAEGGSGNIVQTSISYRTFSGSTTTGTGTLTLLDWRVTEDVPLLPGEPQATVYDFVYRDSSDNKLVFATRYLNREENDQEVNFLYRYGFTGLSTAAAWTFSSDYDLRLYQAGRTASTSADAGIPVAFDADAVRQRGDFSLSEGNPWSGLFFVKTDARYYTLGDKAIGFFQTGEESQSPVGGHIGGFIPTAVPEPETYAMLLVGLGTLGFAARRRKA
jgi:hypothetical protein